MRPLAVRWPCSWCEPSICSKPRGGQARAPVLHLRHHGVGRFDWLFVRHRFLERHDHERLIILGRTIAGEFADGAEERFLDVFGGEMAAIEQRSLETLEAERLAVIIDRFDQHVAVENEAIAGCETDDVLAERPATTHAERETPR